MFSKFEARRMGSPKSRKGDPVVKDLDILFDAVVKRKEEMTHIVSKYTEIKLREILDILWESPSEISEEDGDKIEDIIRDILNMEDRNATT